MTARGTVAAGSSAASDGGACPTPAGSSAPARAVWALLPRGVTSRRGQRHAVRATAVLLAGLAVVGGGSWRDGSTRVPAIAAGTPVAAATAALHDAGLAAGRELRPSDDVAAGLVLGQRPEAGTDVDARSRVVLVVSSGPSSASSVDRLEVTDARQDEDPTS